MPPIDHLNRPFHTLKVESKSPHAAHTKVWLDGMPIGLRGLDIRFELNDKIVAELRINVDDLEIDAETMAYLAAYANRNGGDDDEVFKGHQG